MGSENPESAFLIIPNVRPIVLGEAMDEHGPVLDAKQVDTAIFYSINNCQRGLDGISFGNFLIKRVVGELSQELGNLTTFSTLSPIPGFLRWLNGALAAPEAKLVTEEEAHALRAACPPDPALPPPTADSKGGKVTLPALAESGEQALLRILGRRAWLRDGAAAKALEPVMTRLCAHYLLQQSSGSSAKRARDPVAHFHLSNGARVERINWKADTSEKGLREAAGLMVNYLYDPAKIEDYHEDYVGEGKRAATSALRKLARA